MKTKANKLTAVGKWIIRRTIWIVVIVAVFIMGYWIRGALNPKSVTPRENTTATTVPQENKVQWWTCSMHPQIKLPKPGLCPKCNMELIPLESSGQQEQSLRELTVSESARKLMDIQTVPVERKFVTAEIRMVGKVDYDEIRLKYITSWIPGRLDRLYVDYTGVPVKKGDHMVYLYSPELLSAQEELIQAIQAAGKVEQSESSLMRKTAQATVAAAREKLRLWGLTPEQIAEIENRSEPSDHMTIYAPAGGIVVHKNAQEGMYVQTGTRIYTIADLSVVWVRLDAYESELMWLRYGQPVEFTTESYPGEVFTGTIAFIDPILDETTRTVKIRVNVPNADMRLKPGMFVRAVVRAQVATAGRVMDIALAGKWICPMHPDVIKDSAGDCDICGMPLVRTESLGYVGVTPRQADRPLVIPASAALITGTRAVVYVELPTEEKPTFEGREIVLGPRAGDYYLVRHGLQEGERVVTKGSFKLDAELQIQAKPSMMTPEGGGGGMHMHMGGQGSKAGAKMAAGAMPVALPEDFREALEFIITASADIQKAILSEDLPLIRSAYASLQKAVEAVDAVELTGHNALWWKEYSMLLGNDGVEGNNVKGLSDARRVARQLNEHITALKSKFGLAMNRTGAMRDQAKRPAPDVHFQQQFQKVLADYLSMAQALASDDPEEALAAAKQTEKDLQAVDMKLLAGDQHVLWMKQSPPLQKKLGDLLKETQIEPIRKQFAILSEQIAAILGQFNWTELTVLYELKCPMAFNNRGAVWLQDNKDTRNPYFGTTMLNCGKVIQTFAPQAMKGGRHGS